MRWIFPAGMTRQQEILASAWVLVGIQLVIRSWSVLRGWFYSDDFIFLEDALDNRLGLDYLFTPHDSHLMPIGNAITWGVAQSGTYNWLLAGTSILVLQLVAAGCCLLMLRTVFGDRWAILVPLALYLFSTMDLDAVMWWAAAVNVLPLHIGFFLTVTFAVRHVRSPGLVTAAAGSGAYLIGLLADPRGLQTSIAVGLVLVLFYTAGPLWRRPWRLLRRTWTLLVPIAVLSLAYVAAYAATTTSPVASETAEADPLGTARTMLGTSWLTSLVGGPWRWTTDNPPMGSTDVPPVLHVAAALAVLAMVVWAVRRSPRTTAAAATVLAGQLVVSYLGLTFGRALALGADAGLLMRFLGDSLPVTALALGLAVLRADGATLVAREPARRHRPWAGWAVGAGTVVLAVGCIVSTVSFVRPWHEPYPARAFVENARASLQRDPAVIADVPVPDLVQSGLSFPNNLPSRLLQPIGSVLRTSTAGNDLRILDDDGVHQQAAIRATTNSERGPSRGCGYRVGTKAADVSVDRAGVPLFWWMSISYLSSADGEMTLQISGQDSRTISVQSGIHTFYLQGDELFSDMTFSAATPDLTVCVDQVSVGEIVPVG